MKKTSSARSRIRSSDLPEVLKASQSRLSARAQSLVQSYIFALMVRGFPKTLTTIATYFGLSICSLSRLLSNPFLGEELDIALNRQVRRAIANYFNKNSNHTISVRIIIDATTVERFSQKAENVGLYHSNGTKVWGHRLTNVGLLLDGTFYIPLAVLPHQTRRYARHLGLSYLTEGVMVRHWLRSHMLGLFDLLKAGAIKPENVLFLLDAGYDNAAIQKDIRSLGGHFVMMIKCSRKIGGMNVKKYFLKMRNLGWQSVHLKKKVNKKNKRRKFRIRIAEKVLLAGVGTVTAVCSEKASGSRKKKTRRYLACSQLDLSGREILEAYSKRWTIEVWHKDMKQNYGLGDCSASEFTSINNHLKLCLIAYIFHLQDLKTLPAKGTTIEEYAQYVAKKETRRNFTIIHGAKKIDEAIKKDKEKIFRRAA